MKHKFNLEAATAYATLLNEYVDDDERDDFNEDFEEFLDAYDKDNADVKVSGGEDNVERWTRLLEDAIEYTNFNGDVEKFAKANGLKFGKQLENSRLSELYKRFIANDNVNFFSARRRNNGSIEIHFEEIRED